MSKVGRPKKIEPKAGQVKLDTSAILSILESSQSARDFILTILKKPQTKVSWRGAIATPPGSLLELIIREFKEKTSIPLEIPFFTFFSVLSGYLLNKDVIIETDESGSLYPDIWNVILSKSGSGKTYTLDKIVEGLPNFERDIEFHGTAVVSGAAFVQQLSNKPRGLWLRDEFSQFIRQLETNGPMMEVKDYLLRLYDNDKIERRTKKEFVTQSIYPALAILGTTVAGSFSQNISAEMMLEGFAQRFSYVLAQDDPDRPWIDYPIWSVDSTSWHLYWNTIIENIKPIYRSSSKALETFRASFEVLYSPCIPESFYRRILWRAHKYALLYHILRLDSSVYINHEDYGWAARIISMQINDTAFLIGEHNLSPLERMVQKSEEICRNMQSLGKVASPRDIIRGVRAISNAAQARAILSMINQK